MSKPIGHFTSYTINDGSLLESLQEEYGPTFELMTRREKLFLISAIAIQLCDQSPGRCRDEIYVVGHQINSSLPLHDREGSLEALSNQIRHGQTLSVEELPIKQ
ncbi:hypothetical protein [Nostoc sp. 'Peltigera membranacea cyanobiont' 232]|uniref:hypothetical protein n=1 Tax=Nostoc sp. 'Peltigera membranacea cyanobiont' 232 TaxID=2014531 RepID=UPI0011815639|nr:hypothetical protein [Nostoc sp. 'Peltigera membranacea cyanobiont' 232]